MIALIIILAVILLLLFMPVGVDAAYLGGNFTLAAKIGFLRLNLVPGKGHKEKKPKKEKPEKEKKQKKKKEKAKDKPKRKLTKDDILSIAKIALKMLGRFRRKLCFDELMLHLTVAMDDPCDTVTRYGQINAAISGLLPPLHKAFRIRKEDIGTAMDFFGDRMSADAKVTATLRIWEILYIVICAGAASLVWWLRRRRRIKKEEKAQKRVNSKNKPEEGI